MNFQKQFLTAFDPPFGTFQKIHRFGRERPKVNCAMRSEMGTNVESPTSVDGVSSCEKRHQRCM